MTLIRHHGELVVLGRNQAMRMLLEISANSTAHDTVPLREQITAQFDAQRISQIKQELRGGRSRGWPKFTDFWRAYY